MSALSLNIIASLLEPYVGTAQLSPHLYSQLSIYLELILKWNARVNLTAIRDPETIIQRHFGESLFAGLHLDQNCDSLLDFGSGAGFPGIPIQLLKPDLAITLAESRARKASFLREVVRVLDLKTAVWADRVEKMPEECHFDTVALRAVDDMHAAIAEASKRSARQILILGTRDAIYPGLREFRMKEPDLLPNSSTGVIWIGRRAEV